MVKRSLLVSVAAVATAGVVLVWLWNTHRGPEIDRSRPLIERASMAPISQTEERDAVAGVGSRPVRGIAAALAADYLFESVTDTTGAAFVAAEVTVAALHDARFNTASGQQPPGEFDIDDPGVVAYRPVVVDADEYFKTPDSSIAGFVVPEWGGVVQDMWIPIGEPMYFEVGDEGMAFLVELPAEHVSAGMPYVGYLTDLADSLSEPGEEYTALVIRDWFSYDSGSATGWRFADDWLVEDLRSVVSAACGL